VHTDHLDTPRRITRPSDNKVRWQWEWDVTPFGAGAPNQNPSSLGTFSYNMRFPGQYYDAETGLHYNYFRDGYDSATGRYTQSDPIGLAGGLNSYAYVSSKVLSRFDPFGLREYPDDFMGPLAPGDYRTSEMTQTRCGRIPPRPPNVSVDDNLREAQNHIDPFWFRDQVRNKGPWDYKQRDPLYQDFGNWNYGASGRAFGFSLRTLQREAGRAQIAAGTSRPQWGEPGKRSDPGGGKFPFGDDPTDSRQIDNGVQYCECMGQASPFVIW